MATFCRVSLFGFLGRDPETRYTPNGAMNVQFTIAVNPARRRNDTQDGPPAWYRITAWGELAERVDKLVQQGYITKGRPLYVEGRLEPRQYQANDGTTQWSFDVNMSGFEFIGDRRDQQNDGGSGFGGQAQGGYGQQNRGQQDSGGYDDDPGPSNIDDVPF